MATFSQLLFIGVNINKFYELATHFLEIDTHVRVTLRDVINIIHIAMIWLDNRLK